VISSPQKPQAVALDTELSWYGGNREVLNAMMAEKGIASSHYRFDKKPVAVFDWDNTVMKNDIGDATVFWLINHDKIRQPPSRNWKLTSPWLTDDANNALKAACDHVSEPGAPLVTSQDKNCATEIAHIYLNNETTGKNGTEKVKKAAFLGWNHTRMEPAYAWAAQLQTGYSVEQIKSFVRAAKTENISAPIGTRQSVGNLTDLNGYIRIYDPMRNLITALQKNGFDVWIVSASPQAFVEVVAEEVNIETDRVIGIRNVMTPEGVFTYNLQGCGSVPDGSNDGNGHFLGNDLITYVDGKRCWINKVIYQDNSANALLKNQDADFRPVFAAGDSDTDVTFLQDASTLKLVINRNKKALMCNAYQNADQQWLINPMFIEPKAEYKTIYPCSTTACKDATGKEIPCLNQNGKPIDDQKDSVFAK